MTHAYQLYEDIDAQCLCCRALQPFHFTSAADQVVCSFCVRHIGADRAERRDSDHVALWSELYSELQDVQREAVADATLLLAERDASITSLTSQVGELRGLVAGQFDQTDAGGIRAVLENDLVKRAERKIELATRRNDRALAALWRVARVHADDATNPTQCACGRSVMQCPDRPIIEGMRQELGEWEARNVALHQAGERHGLPSEHPALG
ncbi:hypothetical protein [Glaciibacter psychrotolerans]|uniref:Uncharacterized protein n=1 Tax=Glaciibacter psychrotolerans TaxID=670054 RepID=A0A7Z0J5X9_9MICO|nr:hypothetical protein [Leifsonia psychrotolerans]NYJ19313.1 hypothetical protein [Leifsonia psychrotolerans]